MELQKAAVKVAALAVNHASGQRAALRVLLATSEHGGEELLRQGAGGAWPPFEVVGRAASESRVLQLFFRLAPDVVVLDWRMTEHEPARLVGLLKRVAPGACVVAVVPAADSMPARAAHALGADVVTPLRGLPARLRAIADPHAGGA